MIFKKDDIIVIRSTFNTHKKGLHIPEEMKKARENKYHCSVLEVTSAGNLLCKIPHLNGHWPVSPLDCILFSSGEAGSSEREHILQELHNAVEHKAQTTANGSSYETITQQDLDQERANIDSFLNPDKKDLPVNTSIDSRYAARLSAHENRPESQKGLRYNSGKLRWRNFPLFLLRPLAEVGQYGETKYDAFNFLNGLAINDLMDCMKRHLDAFEDPARPDKDEESGVNHLAHVAWNALVALYYAENNPDLDDRWKGPKK